MNRIATEGLGKAAIAAAEAAERFSGQLIELLGPDGRAVGSMTLDAGEKEFPGLMTLAGEPRVTGWQAEKVTTQNGKIQLEKAIPPSVAPYSERKLNFDFLKPRPIEELKPEDPRLGNMAEPKKEE